MKPTTMKFSFGNKFTILFQYIVTLHLQVQSKCAAIHQGMWVGCDCPFDVDLVCGSNLVTYKNMCTLFCAAANDATIHFIGRGECSVVEHPCKCYPDNKPVCGSDGRDYDSKCDITCQRLIKKQPNLHAVYLGKCTDDREAQWQMSVIYVPATPPGKKSIVVTTTEAPATKAEAGAGGANPPAPDAPAAPAAL